MREQNDNPLDVLGDRLGAAFSQAESNAARRRKRRPIAAAVALFVAAMAAYAVNARVASNEVFSVQEAIAAVVAKNFDQPVPQTTMYLYENMSSQWLTAAGLDVSRNISYETRVLARIQTERWTKPGLGGWVRTTEFPGKFPTVADREAAESMREHNERMAKRAERERRKRGDRRPVPRDFLTGYFPISSALSETPVEPRVTVCRIPAWGLYRLGGQFSFTSLPEPTEIPETTRGVLKLLIAKTRGFRETVDRTGWLWATISLYLASGNDQLNAKQRAALVRAIGQLGGVSTTGKGPDPLGRESIGFQRVERGVKYTIYFDAETGLPIYTSGTVVDSKRSRFGKVPAGTIVERQVLNDFEYVDSPPALKESTRHISPIESSQCQMFRGSLGRTMKKRALRIQRRLERRGGE